MKKDKKIRVAAVIPARMGSSRFPGKPLKPILGLPMVEHVRRRTLLCREIDEVIVATCDREIIDAVQQFGGKAVMTSDRHESCVDRVAEAAKGTKADIIVNVQGDMPFVNPQSLAELIKPFKYKEVMFTDMMGPITIRSEINSPNVVKVIFDSLNNAIYYSRFAIPSLYKCASKKIIFYKQFGINAYRRKILFKFSNWKRTPLEKAESVDMLRALEHGQKVRVVNSLDPVIGVDTEDDLKNAERAMSHDSVCRLYMRQEEV